MRKKLAAVLIVVFILAMFVPFPASAARRTGSRLVAQLQARINELTDLANARLTQIQQLQNDVAFRDGIIADLRARMAAVGVRAGSGLIIVSHTSHVNTIGYFEVNGEVQNNTGSAMEYPKIVATFYDSSGAVVESDFTYAELTPLQPGQKAPFRLWASSSVTPRIARYELQTSY